MKLTTQNLSDCIKKYLKIDTLGMTTKQLIKIIKHALEKKDIILSTLILPHCSLPKHNNKDNLCLDINELKELAKKNNIKVSQTREKLCQELEFKGLVKIIRKETKTSPKKKLIKLYPDEILLFKKYKLETNLSNDQLKENYRILKVKLHPDKGGNAHEFKKMYELYEYRKKFWIKCK